MEQNNDSMQNLGELTRQLFDRFGYLPHIPALDGDYVDEETGYLFCGKCHTRKEYKLPMNGRMVPVPCAHRKAEMEAEERRAQEQREMNVVLDLMQYSITDARFKESTFDRCVINRDNEKAVSIARKYVQQFDRMEERNAGLLFYGPPGTGKSFLAACVANALMEKRVPVLATSIIKQTSAGTDTVAETSRKMRGARVLLLDDFGAERGTDFKLEQVFNIIDERYNIKKPLIITTNLSMQEMKEADDMRYRRIFERVRAMCYPVKMDGESFRKRDTIDQFTTLKGLLEGGD